MSKSKKIRTSIIAIFLTLVMLFVTTPMDILKALANEIKEALNNEESIEQEYYYGDMADYENIGKGYILQENEQKRTSTTKEFLMSDNTIMVQQFIEPVHYYENGSYKNIDNTLIEKIIQGRTVYKNKANSFNIEFSNEKYNNHSVNIEESGFEFAISYKPKKIKEVKFEINNSQKEKKNEYKKEKFTRPQKNDVSKGQILYSEIEENTKILYQIENKKLSKNIIINEKQESYSYVFEIQSSNLQFEQNKDGSIYARNSSGEIKFFIPVPYIVDAEKNFSDAVELVLKEKGKKIELTIIPNSVWINEQAEFPVTVIPEIRSAINKSFSYKNVFETYEMKENSAQAVCVGQKSEKEKGEAFVNFSLPKVTPYYQLLGASVNLGYETYGMDSFSDADAVSNVYVAESVEDLSSITYKDKPNKKQNLNGIEKKTQNNDNENIYESKIINPSNIEFDTLTIGIEPEKNLQGNSYLSLSMTANETSVVYWYQQIIGIDDEYSMEEISINGATAYVNNSTGKLSAVVDLASINTLSDIPLNTSLIYNDYYDEVLKGINENKTSHVGNNVKINFQQFIYQHGDLYEYIDADGSITTFKQIDGYLYYSGNKGLYYNAQTGLVYDALGNIMQFINGRLVKIYSESSVVSGNPTEYIEVVYENDITDKILEVKYFADSEIKHKITFHYDIENKVDTVITHVDNTNNGAQKALEYDENGNLIAIKNQTENYGTTTNDGVQTINLGYWQRYYNGVSVQMLTTVSNNLKNGIYFYRNYTNNSIYEARSLNTTGESDQTRCVSSIEFIYDVSCTKISYFENNVFTNARNVSFNNTKKIISEWQQNAKGIVSVQTTTNWRNLELSTTDYTEETCEFYHREADSRSVILNEGANMTKTIKKESLGIETQETFNADYYRYAVIFQIDPPNSHNNIAQEISLSVKIGDSLTEDILMSQGGQTYICVPCEYFAEATTVTIINSGHTTFVVSYFYYAIIDTVIETNTYYDSLKHHKLTSAQTYLKSGVQTLIEYDFQDRIVQTCTTRLETGDVEEFITYEYYSASATSLEAGKIKQIINKEKDAEGNIQEIDREIYTYTGSWSDYTQTVTTLASEQGSGQNQIRTRTKNRINRNSKTVWQTDENNITTTAKYTLTQGDVRLIELVLPYNVEKYTYNVFGNLIELKVYDNSNQLLYRQSNDYDANGTYKGATYYNGENTENSDVWQKYNFTYDTTGFLTSIDNGEEQPLLEYAYYPDDVSGIEIGSNSLQQTNFANGHSARYTYNRSSFSGKEVLKTEVEYGVNNNYNSGKYVYNYNDKKALINQSFVVNNVTQIMYDYGQLDSLYNQTFSILGLEYQFKYITHLDKQKERVNRIDINSSKGSSDYNLFVINYDYNKKGLVSEMSYNVYGANYIYDKLDRMSNKTTEYYNSTIQNESYVYKTYTADGQTYTTNQLIYIDDQTYNNSDRASTYYPNGLIKQISYNNSTYTYEYDSAGRLTQENVDNEIITSYSYDNHNNIISSGLTYDSNGILTAVNGRTIVYDEMGNPTTYKGNTFTWTQGRKLSSGSINGKNFTYSYDGNGMRYKKTVNGATTEYYYYGTQLLMENRNGKRIYYIYGSTGIEGMMLNNEYNQNEVYYFDKNTLGDIISIRNQDGQIVATYDYDAWGRTVVMDEGYGIETSTTFIGNINPFRYRGYYYDNETGFYYLQTRYYDPEIMRFINADNYELVPTLAQTAGQLNMYAYCNNNPIMYTDETGEWILFAIVMTVFTVAGGVVGYSVGKEQGHEGWELVGDVLLGGAIGAATGGLTLATIGAGVSIFGSAGLKTVVMGIEAYRLFAIGAATYNLIGAIVGPIIGQKIEMIEWGNLKKRDNPNTNLPPAIMSPLATLYCVGV